MVTTIIIGSNDTALIYTKEAIYVSRKIGGTYHSKVSLVSKGLGHIGTTLDPEYLGLSLIAVHNHSDKPFELKVGSTFVSLMFHYLKTPTYVVSHNNIPGQIGILQKYEETAEFKKWSDGNDWINEQRKLKKKMTSSGEYDELNRYIKEIVSEEYKLIFYLRNNIVVKYSIYSIIAFSFYYISSYLNETYSLGLINEHIVSILTLIGVAIFSDLSNYFK